MLIHVLIQAYLDTTPFLDQNWIFFEDLKIPRSHWLYIIFLWSTDKSNKKVLLLTRLSLFTVNTALQRLQDICSLKIIVVCRAWNNNNLPQIFAILQPKQYQLHAPQGWPLRELCWPLSRCLLKHNRKCQIKRKLKAINGTVKSNLPSYLNEYNWRKCYPCDPFDNLLKAIAEFCPPNKFT